MAEIGGRGETWEIIKQFNAEYRNENATWVHSVNEGYY